MMYSLSYIEVSPTPILHTTVLQYYIVLLTITMTVNKYNYYENFIFHYCYCD